MQNSLLVVIAVILWSLTLTWPTIQSDAIILKANVSQFYNIEHFSMVKFTHSESVVVVLSWRWGGLSAAVSVLIVL